MKNTSLAGVLMALAAAGLWGTTGTAQTFASSQTSAYWVGALRLLIASGFFLAVVVATHRQGAMKLGKILQAWHWFALGGVCVAGYNLTFFAGVKATGVAAGTAVALGSGPVWVGLLQSLITRQVPRAIWWVGTGLAILGICLMVTGKGEGAQFDGPGLALCLLAGLSYAGYILVSKHLTGVTTPQMATFLVFGTAALIALPIAAGVSPSFQINPSTWLMLVYLGVVTTGFSYLLFSNALRQISATTGVTLALAEPVTAFLLAIVVVGEKPGALAYAGLACVLVGLLVVVWAEARAKKPA